MQGSCPEWTKRAMRLNPAEMLSRKRRSRSWPVCNRVGIPDTAVGCSHTILDAMGNMDPASGITNEFSGMWTYLIGDSSNAWSLRGVFPPLRLEELEESPMAKSVY